MTDALRPTEDEALAAWAARVRANRDQAERLREPAPPGDFYAPIAATFRADPRRTDEPALDVLRSLIRPGETWIDIGAGGGRYALPIALLAGQVIAVEPAASMRGVLERAATEEAIDNVRVVDAAWPMSDAPQGDVAFIAHVGYDIEAIGPFLEGMERAARRLCVAVLLEESPATPAAAFWPRVHGEARAPLPALPEFLTLLSARGKAFEVRGAWREPSTWDAGGAHQFNPGAASGNHVHEGGAHAWLRQQLFVAAGSAKDRRLMDLAETVATERDGRWAVSWERKRLGIVSWEP